MSSSPASIEKVHVTRTPGVCGGKPCIAGTRIRVWDIACFHNGGDSPEEILAHYPHITLADIHAAIAYYYDHRDEIEAQIAADDKFVEEMRAKFGPGPLEAKLMEAQKARGGDQVSP